MTLSHRALNTEHRHHTQLALPSRFPFPSLYPELFLLSLLGYSPCRYLSVLTFIVVGHRAKLNVGYPSEHTILFYGSHVFLKRQVVIDTNGNHKLSPFIYLIFEN